MIVVVRSPFLTFEKKQNSAFITPFGTMAQISIGYSAYIKALRANGVSVVVDAIYDSEKFTVSMTEKGYKLNHEKTCFQSDAPVKVWFAHSFENNGFSQFLGMDNAEIEKRKKVAKTSFVWDAWKKEMSLKTVLLRLCNFYYRDLLGDLLSSDIDNEIDNDKAEMQAALSKKSPAQLAEPKSEPLPEMGANGQTVEQTTEADVIEILSVLNSVEHVNKLFKDNRDKYTPFVSAFAARKAQIIAAEIEKESELEDQKESETQPELNPDLFSKTTESELIKMIGKANDKETLASLKQDCIDKFGIESVELNGTFYKSIAERSNFLAVTKSRFLKP
jgi:recombinational DNA repair protein RecT